MSRIAANRDVPLGLILARLGIASSERHNDMPTDYGIWLTEQQIENLSAMSGVPADAIQRSLLSQYHGGPLYLPHDARDGMASLATLTRTQWVHLSGSNYCPDCLRVTGGAWSLAWKLPWSYACVHHRRLLGNLCPGCHQPSGRGRGDRSARPSFIGLVPDPQRCGNALRNVDTGYGTRQGRAARPCRQDLTTAHTGYLTGPHAIGLRTQERLNGLLAARGHADTWADLRALVTVLMYYADAVTLSELAPDLTADLLTTPAVREALLAHDNERQERAAVQTRLRDGGIDHRRGTRQRYGTATPSEPALMAILTPIAVRLGGPFTPAESTREVDEQQRDGLAILTRWGREDHKQLKAFLSAAGATSTLVEIAEDVARRTGRFSYASGAIRAPEVNPHFIPAYLWESESDPFVACLPATKVDTVRRFVSVYLVKVLTGDSWKNAANRLGHTHALNLSVPELVNRMTNRGTRDAFQAASHDLLQRLHTGQLPQIDYAERRHRLRNLRTLPAMLLRATAVGPVTTTRRRNSAVWVWTQLTSGHPWDAPAWGQTRPTAAERTMYRRFEQRDLAVLAEPLLTYGNHLLGEDLR